MNSKTPLYFITGFLGSGKTTFISRMLEEHAQKKRLAIIQNEYAPSGIDGQLLRDTGQPFYLEEISHGSVFCVCQFSGFKDLLLELNARQKPEAILVETTGMADPIAIAQLLAGPGLRDAFYLAHTFTLIDATAFCSTHRHILAVQHQVQIADSLVVSKMDIADDSLDDISEALKAINPFAQQVEADQIVQQPLDEFSHLKRFLYGALAVPGQGGFVSNVFKSTQVLTRRQWQTFIQTLPESTYRLKGYITLKDEETQTIQYLLIQYTPTQYEEILFPEGRTQNELVAIGTAPTLFNELEA